MADDPGIEDLPDEVLVVIFSNLSPKLLKVAALTCTRWNNIISTTSKLLQNYKLNLTLGCINRTAILSRKLSALKVRSLDAPIRLVIESRKIRFLEIIECKLDKTILTSALQQLNLLEALSFESVTLLEEDGKNTAQVGLANLKSLEMIFSSVEILGIIETQTVKDFSFISEQNSTDPDLIVQFLLHQPALEKLKIEGTLKTDICEFDYPFALKSLTIEKVELKHVSKFFIKFLSRHQHSLESLILNCLLQDTVINHIINKMKKLKNLSLIFSSDNRLCPSMTSLDNVTNLELRGVVFFASFRQFLMLFPSLKSFCARALFIRHFHLRNSVHLRGEISYLRYLNENRILQNISEFHADSICNEEHFKEFITDHADTLEVITISRIKDSEFSRSTIVDAISKCKRLKLLRFSSESPIVARMFTKVTLTQPWTLETLFKGERFKDLKLVFRFPDDFSVFRELCRTWDDNLIRDFNTCENYGLNAFVNKFK